MFRDNAKINNNNNNYFTSIYYFILLLLVFFGCSSVMGMANQPIISTSSCYFLDQNTNTLYIGKTAPNQKPQTISSTVSIFSSVLSSTPTINKIILEGSVSTSRNAAVIIKNTHNMYIKYGIEIAPGCTIKGNIALDIQDRLTTTIINYGIIDGTRSAICFNGYGSILNGTITNQGKITSTSYALYSYNTNLVTLLGARKLVIENKNTGLISGNIDISGNASLVNYATVESATITIASIVNFATITNQQQHGLHLTAEVSNSGTIYAKGYDKKSAGLEVKGPAYNSGYITAGSSNLGSMIFGQELTNSGTIHANGHNGYSVGLEVKGPAYNSGYIYVVNGHSLGSAEFSQELTNSGTIYARGYSNYVGLTVHGVAYNYGTITIQNATGYGSAQFIKALTNSGTIYAKSVHRNKQNIALEVSGTVYNSGSIIVGHQHAKGAKGSTIFGQELTNTGIIHAIGVGTNNVGLEVKRAVYNSGSITVTAGDLKLNNNATNDCYINVAHKTILTAGKQLTNKDYFVTASITVDPQVSSAAYFNNQTATAVAKFTAVINEPHINIANQGSLLLQGSSTIGNYTGSASSELVLNLPAKPPKTGNSLVKVTNDATFTQGAKIILAAGKSTFLTKQPQPVTIVTAGKVILNGSVDNLLYSRIYNASSKLSTQSILIQITNASKTATQITADLQLASIAKLNIDLRQFTFINSLLSNKITSAAVENQAVLPPVIITGTPDRYYDYNKKNYTIDVGKTAKQPAATIYANSKPEAVQIGVPSFILPQLDKITFVSNVIGATSPTSLAGSMTKEAIAIIAQITNSYTVGSIEITSTATIKGEKGLAIHASLTTNIVNYGTIAGKTSAIYFQGHGCIVNGTLTNLGIITSADHALYSDKSSPKTPALGASLVIENSKSAVISGGILVTGTASLVNHGSITAKDVEIANITNSASITATDNINISRDLTNSGFIEQTDLTKDFKLGSSNNAYTLINSGYIKVGKATTHHKIVNQKKGYIYLDDDLSINNQVINDGTIESSNKTNFGFHDEVTNSGVIIAPGGFHAHEEFYNKQHAIVESGPGDETLIDKELINSGIITVSNEITAKQNLTNSGTIDQTDLSKDFNLGDTNNQSYTVSNTGYISAGNLIANASITNSAKFILASADLQNHTKVKNLRYIQVTNNFNTDSNTSFINAGTAQLITTSGNIDFKGVADNSAIIIASKNLTTDAKKFTNTGSISIGDAANFGTGGVDNSATITAGNGLKANGLFENKTQGMITVTKGDAAFDQLHNYTNAAIAVTAGNLEINQITTNSGYITASGKISTTFITFNNTQTAQLITTIGGITFGGITNNSATIISADAINASVAKFTNSGTVISNKGTSSFNAIDNNSGVITIKGSAESSKAVNNTGTITIEGAYTANDVFNNTSGVVTLGSSTGTQYLAKFNKKLTNPGTITAINQLQTAQVDNSGLINARNGLTSAEFTNTTNAIVNVTGDAVFNHEFINQSQATLTVTQGSATFKMDVTNKGAIHANAGLHSKSFTNLNGASLKVDNGDLHILKPGALINSGAINILNGHSLVLDDFAILINNANGTLATDNIKLADKGKALFYSPINAQQMTIANKGWVSLQAASTVKDYIGHASSELSLALPKTQPQTALLTTVQDASFSVGAKIILDATGQLGYLLSASPTITIITANNKLTTGLTTAASLESSLLYSRVYSSEASHTLHSGSIFIKISEATITNNNKSITAKLQLTTPASLDMKNLKSKNIQLAQSLYESNDILNGKMASTIRPQGSPYPDGYVNNRANKQINEPKGLIALGRFTNLAGYSIDVVAGISSFLGNVTNDGVINAQFGLELTKTAKFLNLKSGNLTVDKQKVKATPEVFFRGELLNQGNINAVAGLTTNLFTNFHDATLTSGGLWKLVGDATNAGTIYANAGLEQTQTAKFVNLNSGSITIATQAIFSGEASNAGTINIKTALTTNKLTNSQAATLTISNKWQLTGETTNAGTIYVKLALGEVTPTSAMKNSKLTNLEHGNINVGIDAYFNGEFINQQGATVTVTQYTRFDGASINSGIMHLHNASMNASFDNRRGAILYNYANDSISFHQDALNDGTINTPRLKSSTKFTNLQHGIITISTYKAEFLGEASNAGIINAAAYLKTNKFTNSQTATITAGNKWTLLGNTTNDGTIYANNGLELTKTAKFINLQHGSITITAKAAFNDEASNSGTINALASLETAMFTNSKAATLTIRDIHGHSDGAQFNQIATNDGYIYAYSKLTAAKQFTNLQHGSITITNKATFNGAASNAGTINALADLDTDNFTNSQAATLTIQGLAHFQKAATNDGYIYAYNKLTAAEQFTNLQHGSITITDKATFSKEASNAGTINALNDLQAVNFTNSQAATLTVKGLAKFKQIATNDGYIYAYNDLTADNQFTNLQHGSITITANATFKGEASNAGTINALADLKTVNFTNSNNATLTVKGSALFNNELTNTGVIVTQGNDLSVNGIAYNLIKGSISVTTGKGLFDELHNSGVIYASGKDSQNIGLITNGKLHNDGSITITKGNFEIQHHATNDGYIKADQQVVLAGQIALTNRKRFIAKAIKRGAHYQNQYAQFNNVADSSQAVTATAEVTNYFTEPFLNIDNQSSLLMHGPSTVGNYIGNATSELVLVLPTGTAKPTKPLLTVQDDATFTQGSKIILTADTAVTYLSTPTSIDIVTTGGKLVVGGSRADKLLYSRAYDTSHTVIKTGQSQSSLATNSVLIDITQATADSSHITADLQMAKTSELDIDLQHATLVDSLLKNKIISAEHERMAKPAIIVTADPVRFYNYKNNILDIGKPASQPAATIYATTTSVAAVTIGTSSLALPKLDKITFVADVIGAVSTTVNTITKDAVIIYGASTSEVVQGIDIQPSSHIHGNRGIVVNASLTTNINNQGIIEGKNAAICFAGDGCILNGTITNQGEITSTNYALYSNPTNKVALTGARSLVIENKHTGLISCSITVSGNASLVNRGVVNSVNVAIANILNIGNITNSKQQQALHIIAEVSNSGYIKANSRDSNGIGLEVSGTLYNFASVAKVGNLGGLWALFAGSAQQVSGVLVTSGLASFTEITNSGIINAKGINATKEGFIANNKVYNSGHISIDAGSAKFKQQVTNTREIIAAGKDKNGIGLEVSGTLYNISHIEQVTQTVYSLFSSTNTTKSLEMNNLLVKSGLASFNEVTNSGIITASGADANNLGLVAKAAVYNSGTISITKGVGLFNTELTNTGAITAQGVDSRGIGLETTGTVYNYGSIRVTAGDLKLNQGVINNGHIESRQAIILPAGEAVTNYAYFQAKTLKIDHVAGKNNAYFNNVTKQAAKQIARAEFTDIINEPTLNVDNQGSLLLQASSTIGNYNGSGSSDLVLTLPAGNKAPNYPLLSVVNHATFDAGAKIILDAQSGIQYILANTTANIKLLKVKVGHLTISGSTDELIHSRAYKNITNIGTSLPQLVPGSIFFNVVEISTATSSGSTHSIDVNTKLELVTVSSSETATYSAILKKSLLGKVLLKKPKSNPKPKLKPKPKPPTTAGTTKPAAGTTKSKIDTSGIEFYKPIDNHYRLTKDIMTTYNTKLKQQWLTRNRYNLYDANYNIRATIATNKGQDKQHKWSETLLSIGGDSELNTTTFGFTFAYLANKLSTTNLYKSDLHSYHGIAYIVYNLNDIRLFSYKLNDIRLFASGIYSATSHKNESVTGKNANEFSLAVAASHRFIVKDFNIDAGINSQLMGVSLSAHSYKNTADKAAKNNKSFLSLGCFIEAAKSKQLYNGARVSASLTSSYTYIAGIANTDKIMVLDANNNSILIPQDKPHSHRLYTSIKAQVDYKKWFSSLSLNYSKKAHQNIYGGNLAAGYRF